jgi:hypothetical protein
LGEGVETKGFVAAAAGFGDDGFSEGAAESFTPIPGPYVEALHFGVSVFERTEGDAAGELIGLTGEEDDYVFAGEADEFLFEALKAEVDIQRLLVFAKEDADRVHLIDRRGLDALHSVKAIACCP